MTIGVLKRKSLSTRQIARVLGVTEGAVRYHLRRQVEGTEDGRARQPSKAEALHEVIAAHVEPRLPKGPLNLAALHEQLQADFGYEGSLRGLQRYVGRHFPAPARRARRRVETPAGFQAQVDWAEFPRMRLGGQERPLHAFHMTLSHSRFSAIVWCTDERRPSWLAAHNAAFERLGGVPATVRIDNLRTAIDGGSGPRARINPTYARYAQAARFHIDVCNAYEPAHKGKVERQIRSQRLGADPTRRDWMDLRSLQQWTDEQLLDRSRRRTCPATGTSVFEAWQAEREHLAPADALPVPFDVSVRRPVRTDCTVAFEGRQYSVPFAYIGRTLEVRGCAGEVEFWDEAQRVACHPRGTPERILIDPAHYEGEATPEVLPPLPLGRMGQRLAEIAAQPPEHRPLDVYAAIAEVMR